MAAPASLPSYLPSCASFPLCACHRAAFEGNLEELAHLLPSLSLRQKMQLDSQGNTVRLAGRVERAVAETTALLPGWAH